jgi:hypothetical protein
MTQRFDDWSTTANNNTTVGSGAIDIDEGMAPGNVNNALRDIMASAALSFGGLPEGTSRPSIVAAGSNWLDTTTATAPIVKHYDGTDDITVMTFDYTANTVGFAAFDIVSDTSPQLGGNLDVNGNTITSASDGDVDIDPDGTGTIILGAAAVLMEAELQHVGDTNNLIGFGTDTQSFETGGSVRIDISNSGVRFGAANARITTVLDEDAMGSDSATALATQQSTKAYTDAGDPTPETAITTTSGTAHGFTGIKAGANRITFMIENVKISGNDQLRLQIGDSGGYETSDYEAGVSSGTSPSESNAGFVITQATGTALRWHGFITLARLDGNKWVSVGNLHREASNEVQVSGGSKTLSGELDRIQISTDGSNSFTAGEINTIVE